MWRRKEGPQVPLRRSPYWLAAETFLLDSGLEEVSFPNSLTLFLLVIGSQVKPHLEQRHLALVFHLQLHWKWGLAQLGKKKNPYFPCFSGQRRNLSCCGECSGSYQEVVCCPSPSALSSDHLKEGESHLVFCGCDIFTFILEMAGWLPRFLPTLRVCDNSWREVLAFQINTFLTCF